MENINKISEVSQVLHDHLDHRSTTITFDNVWELANTRKRRGNIRPVVFFTSTALTIMALLFFLNYPVQVKEELNLGDNVEDRSSPSVTISQIDEEIMKEILAKEGYATDPDLFHIEDIEYNEISGIADIPYISTFKDFVFNSSSVIKGKVLGTKVFFDETNQMAYTKAKVLVEKSYDNQFKEGKVLTVMKPGAIITHYQQIILKGIDKKFHISEEELEVAKNKLVVSDLPYGEPILPGDQLITFLNEGEFHKGEKILDISGPIIKFDNGELIIEPMETSIESPYNTLELFEQYDLAGLESRILEVINEKKGYSKENFRNIAFNAIQGEQLEVKNWESADVTYYEKGRYLDGEKTSNEIVVVTFKNNNDDSTRVIINSSDHRVEMIK